MDAIDLSILAMAMNSTDTDAYIDPDSGDVHIAVDGEYFDEHGEALGEVPGSWVPVERPASSEARQDMVDFAQTLPDPRLSARLLGALEGSGGFRRFRDAVHHHGDDLGRLWMQYDDVRQEQRALRWLVDGGLIDDGARAALAGELDTRLDACRAVIERRAPAGVGEVLALERELQTAACRADAGRLAQLLAADFAEIGASGRVWDRAAILDALPLEGRGATPIEMRDVTARIIADDVVLVRWTSERDGARVLRGSLWRREQGSWRLVFHQGTPLPADGPDAAAS